MAALMGGCSLQGMAQQITPKDVAGDKEYNRVCREYELKGGDSMELLQAYLDKYPDSRHKNRVLSLIASAYLAISQQQMYKEHGKHPDEAMFIIVSFLVPHFSHSY